MSTTPHLPFFSLFSTVFRPAVLFPPSPFCHWLLTRNSFLPLFFMYGAFLPSRLFFSPIFLSSLSTFLFFSFPLPFSLSFPPSFFFFFFSFKGPPCFFPVAFFPSLLSVFFSIFPPSLLVYVFVNQCSFCVTVLLSRFSVPLFGFPSVLPVLDPNFFFIFFFFLHFLTLPPLLSPTSGVRSYFTVS